MVADVEYGVSQGGDVEPMIRLIASVFSSAEPPAVAMGLTADDLARFLRIIAPQLTKAGLTTVARLPSGGEVVGAMLSGDFAAPPVVDAKTIPQGFRPILAMLEQLDSRYLLHSPVKSGDVHLFMLAVDARFSGRGVAQRLVQNCLENARAKGYRRAVVEATGAVSQHVFRKLGFQERVRVSYKDFEYEGEAVFASIAGHGGAALMDRVLA